MSMSPQSRWPPARLIALSFLILTVSVSSAAAVATQSEDAGETAGLGVIGQPAFQKVLRRLLDKWGMKRPTVFHPAATRRPPMPFKPLALVTDTWKGGTGNWNVAADWSAGIPTNGSNTFNVTIDSGGFDTVTLNANTTISALTVGGTTGSSTLQNKFATAETLTVTGALTVNQTGTINFSNGSTLTAGTLVNNGSLTIGSGSTLNLTNQPNGITDVVSNSLLDVAGSLKAGTASGLAHLGSVEGQLILENGQAAKATPGTGTLTISATGSLDLEQGTSLTVAGNLTNSGGLFTNVFNKGGSANTLTVNGALTNNGNFIVGSNDDTKDVANLQTLVNQGSLAIGTGATLNLTHEPNGITDVVAGSSLNIAGSLMAGAANGLAKLGSVEGTLILENGQVTTAVPGGGALNISGAGSALDLELGTTLNVTGNLTNSGTLSTNNLNLGTKANTLTVSGTLTNSAGGQFVVGAFGDTTDVANVGALVNNGSTTIDTGATLKLTNQPNGITDVVAGSALNIFGTLKAGSASGLASLKSIEGQLVLANGQAATVTSGGGALTVSSSGSLDLEAGTSLTVAGNLTNSGILATNQTVGHPANTLTVNGTLTNNAGGSFDIGILDNATTDVANVKSLVNNGSIHISTGATLNLTNQPNGITDVAAGSTLQIAGTLNAGTANGLAKLASVEGTLILGNGQSTTVTPASGALTVSTSGFFAVEATTVNLTGSLANSGNLTVGAGATLALTSPGAQTNSGTLALAGGTLSFGGLAASLTGKGTVTLANNASNVIQGSILGITLTTNNTIEGAGTIQNLGIVNQGSFIANQTTPLVINPNLLGLNNSQGTLEALAGSTLEISGGGGLTNFLLTTLTGGKYIVGGTLEFDGANIVTNAANISLSSKTALITDQNGVNALKNFTTNASQGTLTLSGNNSLTTAGGSMTNAGLLTIGSGSALTVGNGGLTSTPVNYTQTAGTTTVDGTLTSSTSKTTPTLNLNGGSLLGTGMLAYSSVVDASGTLAPGDSPTKTGKLVDTGSYTQDAAGALNIAIGGKTAGTQFDQFNVTKTAALSGTLNLSLINGFVPAIGDTFIILNASSVAGTFSKVNGVAINASEHFQVTFNANDVVLTVVAGAAPGRSISAATERGREVSGLRGGLSPSGFASPVRFPGLVPAVNPLRGASVVPRAPALRSFSSHSGAGQKTLAYGFDVLALIHSPKHFARTLLTQPGSTEAARLTYFAYGDR
jgi:fibronectin-binding autotransporter adhesin